MIKRCFSTCFHIRFPSCLLPYFFFVASSFHFDAFPSCFDTFSSYRFLSSFFDSSLVSSLLLFFDFRLPPFLYFFIFAVSFFLFQISYAFDMLFHFSAVWLPFFDIYFCFYFSVADCFSAARRHFISASSEFFWAPIALTIFGFRRAEHCRLFLLFADFAALLTFFIFAVFDSLLFLFSILFSHYIPFSFHFFISIMVSLSIFLLFIFIDFRLLLLPPPLRRRRFSVFFLRLLRFQAFASPLFADFASRRCFFIFTSISSLFFFSADWFFILLFRHFDKNSICFCIVYFTFSCFFFWDASTFFIVFFIVFISFIFLMPCFTSSFSSDFFASSDIMLLQFPLLRFFTIFLRCLLIVFCWLSPFHAFSSSSFSLMLISLDAAHDAAPCRRHDIFLHFAFVYAERRVFISSPDRDVVQRLLDDARLRRYARRSFDARHYFNMIRRFAFILRRCLIFSVSPSACLSFAICHFHFFSFLHFIFLRFLHFLFW